tara:strand:+ start:576 stop:950 length:375 start_codon:yes stop_codon:yes gene_type:complete
MAGIGGFDQAPVFAHAGHGDEFVQTGSVGQVKANSTRDQMLGIVSEKPKKEANGQLSVPNVAIVKAYGKPYVFVFSGTTYDPVVIKPGSVSVNRTVVLDGVTADEQIVVSGALSIFAESQKNKR